MAKRSGKCPKCSEHLEFDSDSGEPVVCPGCGARLTAGKSHPPAEPPDQPDPLIGTTLGEFEIGELLGRGAMGAVYKASQPSLGRMVAIKVLPRAPSEKLATRFEREARAAAAVDHPNIINVYSVGSDQGYQYIAMEFVDGETLADVLDREGPLPPERVIEMMKQTASAMVAAHGAGILHRDIKPANILLTPRGNVKVADFGLAKRPDVDVSVTQAGRPLGTPLYMPPEVARGGEFQVASDLYSLGATFYHLLAGRPPFEGGSQAEIAIKQVESDPPPLNQIVPNVPKALAWAIDRLLARKPAERFPTAEALLENLEYIDAGMAASQADSASDTLMPAAKRRALNKMPVASKAGPNKLLIGGIAAGVLVVIVTLILIFTLGPKDETPPEEPPPVVKLDPVVKPKPGPVVVKPKPKPKPPITPKPKPKPPKPKPVSQWTTLANGWRVGKAVNLGPVVNSSTQDGGPSVSADGRTMVFTSRRGGTQGKEDLWMSSRPSAEAPWGKPVNLGAPVNTKACEWSPSLSADGLTLVYQDDRAGGQGHHDLWMSTRRGRTQAWDQPVNLGPPVNSPEPEREPCLSTDGLTLIFTRRDGHGKDDLWMSSRPSAEAPWGEPVNLGAPVNTKDAESEPSLSADGLTLVFTTDRAGGQGRYDLWMSTRAGPTKPFGEPVNLGPSVNSGGVDGGGCLSADGRTLYFNSNRPGGHGGHDIWQAPLLPPGAPLPPAAAGEQIDLGKGVTMKLALIPAGEFMMGSPESEEGRGADEGPQHKVTISPGAPGFYMGVTEVTQEQYEAVMGKNPSHFKGPKNPVEEISWNDAVDFCKKLSAKTRRSVRLPTEAEWEYACRAGTKTRSYFGDDEEQLGDYAWHKDNSGEKTHPVGQKKPNAWGLYDMHGNVLESCGDWYADSYANAKPVDPQGAASGKDRIQRGGTYAEYPRLCRAATRGGYKPDHRCRDLGFRVVVETPGAGGD